MSEIINAIGVKRAYPTAGELFWALKGISLTIEAGKLTILKGRSGSGKTTLVNIMGALEMPTEGQIIFRGNDITNISEKERDRLHSKNIGFVFQSVALVSMMSAIENVEFGLRIAAYPANERRARAEHCLSIVGLGQRMNHMPSELSGGEQQRVAIARAFAHKPDVIFADEPTAELDSTTSIQIIKLFKELIATENATIVMTTHDAGLMEVADKLYELEDGNLAGGENAGR